MSAPPGKELGDAFSALAQNPLRAIGMGILVAIFLLFLRIYLWPWINPFQFQWMTDAWEWLKRAARPSPPPSDPYSYAKVLYPTYR